MTAAERSWHQGSTNIQACKTWTQQAQASPPLLQSTLHGEAAVLGSQLVSRLTPLTYQQGVSPPGLARPQQQALAAEGTGLLDLNSPHLSALPMRPAPPHTADPTQPLRHPVERLTPGGAVNIGHIWTYSWQSHHGHASPPPVCRTSWHMRQLRGTQHT